MEPAVALVDEQKLYRPWRPEQSPFYAVLHQFFDWFTRENEQRFQRTFVPLRGIVPKTVERFLGCGLPVGDVAGSAMPSRSIRPPNHDGRKG